MRDVFSIRRLTRKLIWLGLRTVRRNLADAIAPQGKFSVKVYRKQADGSEILEREFADHNLIVNTGRHLLAMLLAGKTQYHVTHVAIGSSSDAETADDYKLTNTRYFPVTAARRFSVLKYRSAGRTGSAFTNLR